MRPYSDEEILKWIGINHLERRDGRWMAMSHAAGLQVWRSEMISAVVTCMYLSTIALENKL